MLKLRGEDKNKSEPLRLFHMPSEVWTATHSEFIMKTDTSKVVWWSTSNEKVTTDKGDSDTNTKVDTPVQQMVPSIESNPRSEFTPEMGPLYSEDECLTDGEPLDGDEMVDPAPSTATSTAMPQARSDSTNSIPLIEVVYK